MRELRQSGAVGSLPRRGRCRAAAADAYSYDIISSSDQMRLSGDLRERRFVLLDGHIRQRLQAKSDREDGRRRALRGIVAARARCPSFEARIGCDDAGHPAIESSLECAFVLTRPTARSGPWQPDRCPRRGERDKCASQDPTSLPSSLPARAQCRASLFDGRRSAFPL